MFDDAFVFGFVSVDGGGGDGGVGGFVVVVVVAAGVVAADAVAAAVAVAADVVAGVDVAVAAVFAVAAAVDDDAALGNLQFTHGVAGTHDGNIVQFTSSKVDIGDVSYSDSDGIAMFNIPFTCVPEDAANTDFDLIFT